MQIIYDDKDAKRSGESFRLILLNSGWHVVAKCYLCRVADDEEGRQVIAEMNASRLSTLRPVDAVGCRQHRDGNRQ